MKRTFLYILAALLAASCKNSSVQNNKSEGDKPVITVTIEPLRYFTEVARNPTTLPPSNS